MRKRVLLIDDSLTIHKIVELTIDRQAFELLNAYDMQEGIKLAADNEVSVILVDNKICTEDNTYISQLYEASPEASIIMLVGAYDQFPETDPSRLNVQDYIIKPFNAATLNHAIASAASKLFTPDLTSEFPAEIPTPDAIPEAAAAETTADSDENTVPEIPSEPVIDKDPLTTLEQDIELEILESYLNDSNSTDLEEKTPLKPEYKKDAMLKTPEPPVPHENPILSSIELKPLSIGAQPTAEEKLPTVLIEPETKPIPMAPRKKDAPLFEPSEPIAMGNSNKKENMFDDSAMPAEGAEDSVMPELPDPFNNMQEKPNTEESDPAEGSLPNKKNNDEKAMEIEDYSMPMLLESFNDDLNIPEDIEEKNKIAEEDIPAMDLAQAEESRSGMIETEENSAAIEHNEEMPMFLDSFSKENGQEKPNPEHVSLSDIVEDIYNESEEDDSDLGNSLLGKKKPRKRLELDLDDEGQRNLLDNLYSLLTDVSNNEYTINIDETTDLFRQEIDERHELMGMFDNFNTALENVTTQLQEPDENTYKNKEENTKEYKKEHRTESPESSTGFRRIAELNNPADEKPISLGKFTLELSKQEFIDLLRRYLDKYTLEEIVGEAIQKAVNNVMPVIVEKLVRDELKIIKGEK